MFGKLHAAHSVDFDRSLDLIYLVYLLVAEIYVLILRVGVELSKVFLSFTLPLHCQMMQGKLLHEQIVRCLWVLWPVYSCEGVEMVIALESIDSPLRSC